MNERKTFHDSHSSCSFIFSDRSPLFIRLITFSPISRIRIHIHSLIIPFVFILFSSPLFSQNTGLAVAGVEPIGVDGNEAALTEELLHTEFSKSPLFTLVERSKLKEILAEQKLGITGIIDADSAIELGKILQVEKVAFGSIGAYESDFIRYLISLRIVDVERAEVELAETVQVKKSQELKTAVEKLVEHIHRNIEIDGTVTKVEDKFVYTNLGERAGISQGDTLAVSRFEPIRSDAGKVIMREEVPIANMVVVQTSPEGSKCTAIETKEIIENGFFVQKGSLDLAENDELGALEVDSIPKGARVFLDEELIGLTPLSLGGLQPAKYSLEIRANGFDTYDGSVSIRSGRTVRIKKELESELSTEELLLMGKVPRSHTDPGTALKKSLVPGQGQVYNGYKNTGLIVPAQVALFSGVSILQTFNYLDIKEYRETTDLDDLSGYWEKREYYESAFDVDMSLSKLAMLAGSAAFSYGFSAFEAYSSAKANYRYPTYAELAVTGGGRFTTLLQTEDTELTSTELDDFNTMVATDNGVESSFPGASIELIFRGGAFYTSMEIGYTLQPIFMDLSNAYRFRLGDKAYIGPGLQIHMNFSEPDGVNIAEEGEGPIDPVIADIFAPTLSLSYLTSDIEVDAFLSPWALMSTHIFGLGGEWTSTSYFQGIYGYMGELNLNWFFSLTTGLRISLLYAQSYTVLGDLESEGYTTVDNLRYISVGAGLVFRF